MRRVIPSCAANLLKFISCSGKVLEWKDISSRGIMIYMLFSLIAVLGRGQLSPASTPGIFFLIRRARKCYLVNCGAKGRKHNVIELHLSCHACVHSLVASRRPFRFDSWRLAIGTALAYALVLPTMDLWPFLSRAYYLNNLSNYIALIICHSTFVFQQQTWHCNAVSSSSPNEIRDRPVNGMVKPVITCSLNAMAPIPPCSIATINY